MSAQTRSGDRRARAGAGPGGGPMGGMGRDGHAGREGQELQGHARPAAAATCGRIALQLGVVLVFAILSTVFNIVGPKIMGQATTKIFEGVIAKFIAARAPARSGIDFGYIGHILLILIGLYADQRALQLRPAIPDGRRGAEDRLRHAPGRRSASSRACRCKFFDARTHGEILSRVDQRRGQHRHHAAAEPDPAHHLGRHHRRRDRDDADDQPAADPGRRRHAAAVRR